MKALFITTDTSEPIVNVSAWRHTMGPAEHITFHIHGPRRDEEIIAMARDWGPDVMLYTGGTEGAGTPSIETLRGLRDYAPTIHMQGDMADPPWHPLLIEYRGRECFDLSVGIDGVRSAPVDYVTLTPVDLAPYTQTETRPHLCGFVGNHVPKPRFDTLLRLHGTQDPRSAILHGLGDMIHLRERDLTGEYADYAEALGQCRMIINTSWAGSGLVHHVKGRVLEAAFAGCALLEMNLSPAFEWFPDDMIYSYKDLDEARAVISQAPIEQIDRRAAAFSAYARDHYNPEAIYRGMVERVGL